MLQGARPRAKLAVVRRHHPLTSCMPDHRVAHLAELKAKLHALSEEGRATAPGSPERKAVLERWSPIHAAVLALADKLSEE